MCIGDVIKEELYKQGHTASWLAERIPCERSNVYHIFSRNDIGIELLFRISKALNHNFFYDLSEHYKKNEKLL